MHSTFIILELKDGKCSSVLERQWLEQAGDIKISSSQRLFRPSLASFSINLSSTDSSPIYKFSYCYFHLSMFIDRRSLKIYNENNSMKT